jgi:hypothetical protein
MSDQINQQTEKMREMAQTTLDKAKDAVSKYIAESQKMREKADSGVRATYSNVKEMNDKAVAYAEANVAAGSSSPSGCSRRKTRRKWAPSIKII